MDIALDARIAFYNNSGISRFARGLLGAIAAKPPEFTLTVYQSFRDRSPIVRGRNITTKFLYTPPHSAAEPVTLPLELGVRRHRLIHALDFFLPAGPRLPVIAQIYDLYFLRRPEALDKESLRHYCRVRRREQIAHYICSSEATRRDAIELLGIEPARATTIHPGLTEIARPPADAVAALGRRLNLPERIILAVGTIEPRKNLINLFRAFKNCRDRIGPRIPPLVLAGRKGYRADEILGEIGRLGLQSSVYHIGEVSDGELAGLYSLAQVVAYVSSYEGFGFPLLEAFSAGAAVLSSDVSSLPEVGGDAALYVAPEDVDAIGQGLERLLSDEAFRRSLIDRGATVLERYSWGRCAEKTLETYLSTAAELQ